MLAYRHEYKYLLNACQEQDLLLRCGAVLQPDPHVSADGTYLIRSLYFDDPEESCLMENLNGDDARVKFRIRRYNDRTDRILLERKSKLHGLTHKDSCTITEDECLQLMDGDYPRITPDMPSAKQQLLLEMTHRRLFPKVIVSYERVPFVFDAGNVRITFDRKITSSPDIQCFLENDYARRPIFPCGTSLLEVKWDELLPPHLKLLLQTDGLHRTAFSKYALCRCYHL